MVIKYVKKEEVINLIQSNTSFHYQENAREMVIKFIKKKEGINLIRPNNSFHLPQGGILFFNGRLIEPRKTSVPSYVE